MTPATFVTRMENLKLHRRVNDIELDRVKQAFLQGVEVLKDLNAKESVQLTSVRLEVDPLPNATGCAISVDMFVYAPKPPEEKKDEPGKAPA